MLFHSKDIQIVRQSQQKLAFEYLKENKIKKELIMFRRLVNDPISTFTFPVIPLIISLLFRDT